MSRVGKKPIPLPKGVNVTAVDGEIEVKGPNGTLRVPVPKGIEVRNENGTVNVLRESDKLAAFHGLTRALMSNAVTGVSTGFKREMDIVGIGYRAELKGRVCVFSIGYSHPIDFLLPDGVNLEVAKQASSIEGKPAVHMTLSSFDRQLLGQTAANIRALRPPDPYKNKGIRYTGEKLLKKAGKAGAGGKGK